jgi:hypothetical protein
MNVDSIADRGTVRTIERGAAVATTGPEQLHPLARRPDEFNASVAGEEDPGAALDMVGASDAWHRKCRP